MNRRSIILSIIGFLLLISGYSYFRSYIDQISFVIAFDKVTSIIINEIWELFSSPTIFIAILIILLLIAFKENLLTLFPAIKEIKAGSFSAIIDYSQIEKMLSSKTSDLDLTKDLDTKRKKEDVQNYLIKRLGKETLMFFLELDGKSDEFSEMLKTAEQFHIGIGGGYLASDSFIELDVDSKRLYLLGNLLVLLNVTFPAFFDKHVDDNGEGTRTLKDGLRNKMEMQLKVLEQREKG